MACLTLLESFTKQSLDSGCAHCRWVQIFDKGIKRLIYLGYWKTKFSMRDRRKSKHKFGGTKVCKAEEVREYFVSRKI